MEVLGTYDPLPKLPVGAEPGDKKQKDIKVDVIRAKYWLGVGAQPSNTVWRLLSMVSRGSRHFKTMEGLDVLIPCASDRPSRTKISTLRAADSEASPVRDASPKARTALGEIKEDTVTNSTFSAAAAGARRTSSFRVDIRRSSGQVGHDNVK